MPPAVGAAGQAVLLVAEVDHAAVRVGVTVVGGDQRAGRVVDLLLGPGGPAVGGDLDEAVVPVLLDDVVVPHPELRVGGRRTATCATELDVRPLLVVLLYHIPVPLCGVARVTTLSGRSTLMPSSVPTGVRERLPELHRPGAGAGVDGQRVGPAEHPLVPDAHVRRQRLEDLARCASRTPSGPRSRRRSRRCRRCRRGPAGPGRGRTRGRRRRPRRPPAARCSSTPSGWCRGWCSHRRPWRSAPRPRTRPRRRRRGTCPGRRAPARGGRSRRPAR